MQATTRLVDGMGHMVPMGAVPMAVSGDVRDVQGKMSEQEIADALVCQLDPFLLALCFCHCKNVARDAERFPVPLVRKRRESGKYPVDTVYTLRIDPMQRVLRESAGAGVGLKQRLHICRGHFKGYLGERKLFGKLTGTWWWGEQVRGSADRGKVDKVYEVVP
jgi:hypothetical protein